ncbi:MAG: precorrin-6B methylase [bacterium]|nr:precorrin-6B methylase [bacterium]
MEQLFNNTSIINWLQYYAQNTDIDLEHVKMIDITRKNKNVIPTVESHRTTLVFTNAGIDDIFYRLWNAGLGECEVWYNEGSDPVGEIFHQPVKDMINRGINASAAMLIINPNARSTARIGLANELFSRGSIHYVGSEIRSIILNKMNVAPTDDICVISGESIAIEAALIAVEGSVTAVEYNRADRATMEDNVEHFGLQNVNIIEHVDTRSLSNLPVPSLVFLVASASTEQELECLTQLNPKIDVVIYTLDFTVAASMPALLEKYNLTDIDTIQVSVSTLERNHTFKQQPAPWIITAHARG